MAHFAGGNSAMDSCGEGSGGIGGGIAGMDRVEQRRYLKELAEFMGMDYIIQHGNREMRRIMRKEIQAHQRRES